MTWMKDYLVSRESAKKKAIVMRTPFYKVDG